MLSNGLDILLRYLDTEAIASFGFLDAVCLLLQGAQKSKEVRDLESKYPYHERQVHTLSRKKPLTVNTSDDDDDNDDNNGDDYENNDDDNLNDRVTFRQRRALR